MTQSFCVGVQVTPRRVLLGYWSLSEERNMRATHGRVVVTSGQKTPYKVVLDDERGEYTDPLVQTLQEGEHLIKLRLLPPTRNQIDKLRQSSRSA